jgi:beta-phosphoglucomutase-like phosphatase (HAD superfamily)
MRLQNIENNITKDTVLFFDMDGTLVDTNYANFLSYQKAINIILPSEITLIYNPEQRVNRTSLKKIIPNVSEIDYNRIIKMKENCYQDFLSETKLIIPIIDILFKYSKTNNTVLVTNCRENRVTATLTYHGLNDKFSHICCRQLSDYGNHSNKYSDAIDCLNILPQNILVFENEKMEINNVINAGIPSDNIVEFFNF